MSRKSGRAPQRPSSNTRVRDGTSHSPDHQWDYSPPGPLRRDPPGLVSEGTPRPWTVVACPVQGLHHGEGEGRGGPSYRGRDGGGTWEGSRFRLLSPLHPGPRSDVFETRNPPLPTTPTPPPPHHPPPPRVLQSGRRPVTPVESADEGPAPRALWVAR